MNIVALVGSYRKGGVVDRVVDEILAAAEEAGAATEKIYLVDRDIAFCTNCRSCTQEEGPRRGRCIHDDEMGALLDRAERADGLVLASPVNAGTATAVMKRFVERLVCLAYWPWGAPAPKRRTPSRPRGAVVGAASAAPALVARLSGRLVKLLKDAAGLLGARTAGVVFVGLAAGEPAPPLPARVRRKARRLGRALAAHRAGPSREADAGRA
ncbi:MAG: flavodoxin family protein [Deferrisomatales bacterium]